MNLLSKYGILKSIADVGLYDSFWLGLYMLSLSTEYYTVDLANTWPL